MNDHGKLLTRSFFSGIPRTAAAREEANLIAEQHEQIGKLKTANSNLSAKNAQLTEQLEKKKRELTIAKRAASVGKKPAHSDGVAVPPSEVDIYPGPTHKPSPHDPHANTSLLEVSKTLKARYSLYSPLIFFECA
jgi:hypothetical protein